MSTVQFLDRVQRTGINRRRLGRALALSALAMLLQACEPEAAPDNTPAPLTVTVTEVVSRPLPLEFDYTASTQGSREVEVRARVTGILLRRVYREGDAVKQGDLLFQIDPAPFAARVQQSRAALAVAQATLTQAQRNRDRVLPLFDKGLLSAKERDDAVSALEVAQAQTQAAEAALRSAELDLGYTEVRAPISGVAGREMRSEGSLLTAGSDSSLLTRILQVEPLYVEFAAPQNEASRIRQALRDRSLHTEVIGNDGRSLAAQLTFIDNELDAGTSTVRMRAVLDNRQRQWWPGQFMRVVLRAQSLEPVMIVPRAAVLSGVNSQYLWLVDGSNTLSRRDVQLGASLGEQVVIRTGLNSGERVVLDNLYRLKVGDSVHVSVIDTADKNAARSVNASQGAG